jgi:mannose-6-phosphate isomerase
MSTNSLVLNGPLAGRALGPLVRAHPGALLGNRCLAENWTELPLLFKVLDAQDLLSVQVHPDDRYAREVEGMPFGKTEAWYTLDAEQGAYVIHGFARPVTREEVQAALAEGRDDRILGMLRKVPLRRGDSLFVPAGTVHAIGGGLLLAEIQQNSDITYRLYDWGRPREMHVKQGLAVMNCHPPSFSVSVPLEVRQAGGTIRYLVACRYFLFRELAVRGRLSPEPTGASGPDAPTHSQGGQSFHCLFCFEGAGLLLYTGAQGADARFAFEQGQTIFVPAAIGPYTIEGECRLLNATVPDLWHDVAKPLLNAGYGPGQIGALGGEPDNELARIAHRLVPPKSGRA